MHRFMQGFSSHASAKGARSTALHSLQWALGLLLAAIPPTVWSGAPAWLFAALIVAVVLVLLVFLGAYIYLLTRNPDALRSEEFSLSKMAMEKGLVGDTTFGFVDPSVMIANKRGALPISSDQGEAK